MFLVHPERTCQQSLAGHRHLQYLGAPIARRAAAPDQAASRKAAHQRREIGLLESQRLADVDGPQARVLVDDDQYPELPGLQIELRQQRGEAREHRQLGTPERVAHVMRQRSEAHAAGRKSEAAAICYGLVLQ